MTKYFDPWTIVTIIVTILLFVLALFFKGLTHELLLEAGVLLVSIKLILMAYRNGLNYIDIKKDLDAIKQMLKEEK